MTDSARALLEHDASTAAVVQSIALKQAFSNPNEIIAADGKPHFALNTWSKYAQLKRSSLLALKKFEEVEAKDDKPKNLADIIIETSEFDAEDEGPIPMTGDDAPAPGTKPRVEAKPTDQQTKNWNFTLRHNEPTGRPMNIGPCTMPNGGQPGPGGHLLPELQQSPKSNGPSPTGQAPCAMAYGLRKKTKGEG